MNGNIDVKSIPLKALFYFIRIGMPILTIILLLGIPFYNQWSHVEFSINSDFIFRLMLSFMFCLAYANMPFISKSFWYYTFPDFKKTNIVIYPNSLPLSIFMILARFLLFGGMTIAAIEFYLPVFKNVRLAAAFINGLIFALPALAQYLFLKKK
jgi:hypothetical protein